MNLPNPSPAAVALFLSVAAGSVIALSRLFLIHIDGRSLLPYEPRRPVPWNVAAPLLLLLPLFSALASHGWAALVGSASEDSAAHSASIPVIDAGDIWFVAVSTILVALLAWFALAAVFAAAPSDLGWPKSRRELWSDVRLGVFACLAVWLPIQLTQLALVSLIQPEETIHPLIENLLKSNSLATFLAAAVSAVVAAPLFEETAFRLVLQGFLEKRMGTAQLAPGSTGGATHEPARLAEETPGQSPWLNSDQPTLDSPILSPSDITHHPSNITHPPPTDYRPIAISAALFSLAHWGQGVAPVSLLILGAALGYLYQRTHRLLPCLACHACFNGITMALVALEFPA